MDGTTADKARPRSSGLKQPKLAGSRAVEGSGGCEVTDVARVPVQLGGVTGSAGTSPRPLAIALRSRIALGRTPVCASRASSRTRASRFSPRIFRPRISSFFKLCSQPVSSVTVTWYPWASSSRARMTLVRWDPELTGDARDAHEARSWWTLDDHSSSSWSRDLGLTARHERDVVGVVCQRDDDGVIGCCASLHA